tara:strand:- start:14863 stop:15867 length:1005 start_codon:yes stop_codon:yes gene_type:complete
MRRVLWWLLVMGALWSAWWAAASVGVQTAMYGWLDTRRDAGWQAEVDEIALSGFPARLHSRVTNVALAAPVSGAALTAPVVDLSAPAWWPGYVDLRLSGFTLDLPGRFGNVTLTAADTSADLRLHPGAALEMQSLQGAAASAQVAGPEGDWLDVQGLAFSVHQDAVTPALYHISLTPERVTPGAELRKALALDGEWPPAFSQVSADIDILLDRPIDRHVASGITPLPREINLSGIEMAWGKVALTATGALRVDAAGVMQGHVTLKVTHWPILLEMTKRLGVLVGPAESTVEPVLRALANRGDDPDNLDLDLVFDGGMMTLAGIPLGAAPRLIPR